MKMHILNLLLGRSFVDILQGGCQVPIGVKATILDDKKIRVQAIVGMPDGSESISEDILVNIEDYKTCRTNFS